MSLGKSKTYYQSGITRFDEDTRRLRLRWPMGALIVILILLWLVLPVLRAGLLLWTDPLRSAPPAPAGLNARALHFPASDGVRLAGWLVPAAPGAAAIVLVPGFKGTSASMVPYARFLHRAGFNVLLYDSRGTGGSGGAFSLGVREVDDVRGAVAYLGRHVRYHRYGLLGVSLGAGEAVVAAAHLRAVSATVADSTPADEHLAVSRLDSLHLGPLTIPSLPLAEPVVDRVLGVPLSTFSPLRAVSHIAPRALLLIHSRHDTNPTTPLQGALALHRAAGANASLWIAPRGDHAGALAAQPAQYQRRVIAFFRRYLQAGKGHPRR